VREMTPRRGDTDPSKLTAEIDKRTTMLLKAAAMTARAGRNRALDTFSVRFAGAKHESDFIVEVQTFGSSAAVVVIGWAHSDQDIPALAL
jgi:hypothetical protein